MADNIWLDIDGDWTNTANWSLGLVPIATHDVYIEEGIQSIITNIDQNLIALNSLNIAKNFVGEIGDRDNYLQIRATTVNIGYNKGSEQGAGSNRLNINLGSAVASVINVFASASSATDPAFNPIRLLINNAAATMFLRGGSMSLATDPGEVAELASIVVDQSSDNANLQIGQIGDKDGVTLASLQVQQGFVLSYCDITLIDGDGGDIRVDGAAIVTTIHNRASRMVLNGTGTIVDLYLYGRSSTDFTQNNQARTVSEIHLEEIGYSMDIDVDVVTVTTRTNNIDLPYREQTVAI